MPIYNEDTFTAIRDNLFLSSSIRSSAGLRPIFAALGLTDRPVIVKPNWFSNHRGQFTDAPTLELILQALGGPVTLVEGHSFRRSFATDELHDANVAAHRELLRTRETEFLEKTGLATVIAKYGTRYINVTEECWRGNTVPAAEAEEILRSRFVELSFAEIYGVMPRSLAEMAGAPLVSLARLKIPGSEDVPSLSLKNMFGLIPDPDRRQYHPRLADAVIDINLLYGAFFPIYGVVEGLYHTVAADNNGTLTAFGTKYNDLTDEGIITAGENPIEADILATIISGGCFRCSGFYESAALIGDWDPMLPLEAERYRVL